METFDDFFEESCRIHEIYENFGAFGRETYKSLLNEALISSYPYKMVREFIQYDLSLKNGYFNVAEYNEKNKVISGELFAVSSDKLKVIKKELEDALAVYGYFIGKANKESPRSLYVMIEPRFPSIIDRSTLYRRYYHITHQKYLDKIMKIGLTPRSSQTTFSHPGGRIYLLDSPSEYDQLIPQFKFMISGAKNSSLLDSDSDRYYRSQGRGFDWSSKKLVILKVNLPDNIPLYYDPMFPSPKNSESTPFFITRNIRPENIEVID